MKLSLSRLILLGVAPLALAATLVCPARATAQVAEQDHIVPSQALQQQAVTSSAVRQKNIETLNGILNTPTAQKAIHDAHVTTEQVKGAIPTLSDDELANLSGRVTKAQNDLSAGYIGTGLFTIIILAVILIIIIIVIH